MQYSINLPVASHPDMSSYSDRRNVVGLDFGTQRAVDTFNQKPSHFLGKTSLAGVRRNRPGQLFDIALQIGAHGAYGLSVVLGNEKLSRWVVQRLAQPRNVIGKVNHIAVKAPRSCFRVIAPLKQKFGVIKSCRAQGEAHRRSVGVGVVARPAKTLTCK